MTSMRQPEVVPEADAAGTSSRLAGFLRGFVIFAYGLFSIAAQALIFREFITSFESNDIIIGIFFGCWFLWVALGALLINKSKRLAGVLSANIELLFLAYLPAFVLQTALIINIRRLAGIAPYTLLPIPIALLLGIVVNAPVSLITGLLFPLSCQWLRLGTASSVSRVYLLESLGSFAGGLGTTLLLAFGASSAQIFLMLSFVLSAAVFCCLLTGRGVSHHYRKTALSGVFVLMLLSGFALSVRADKSLAGHLHTIKWSRLLPPDSLAGSFQTAQAEYLYGLYQGQWVVVREGSVTEVIPDPTSAGRIVALTLSQNPTAERVLVIGSGLGLCRQFIHLPHIDHLLWVCPDNEYGSNILKLVPREMSISDTRFEHFTGDIRSMLSQRTGQFDLVIVNIPDAASSVSNRYLTLDFFQQVKSSLNPGGIFAVCVPGGENIMGTELVTIGASTKLTLAQVFPHLVLAPGDISWFIASDADTITGDPGTLRNRFASIRNAAEVYPPNGLLSIYLPDRAAKALDAYSTADLPDEHLLNRDSRPLANLYGLLLTAKQSDATITLLFKHLLLAGFPAFVIPIIIYILLRFIFVMTSPASAKSSTFDCTFLVFSTGAVGIGIVIVLMFLYQTRFGSLYLYIGAVSSLYMAGLATGAVLARRLTAVRVRIAHYLEMLLVAVLVVQGAVLMTIAFWPAESWSHLSFGIMFIVCGLCAGCYFPLAARMLADSGLATTLVGSRLEAADHSGAVAGGLFTSLAIVPVLGTRLTLLIFILFLLANLPYAALRMCCPAKVTAGPAFRSIGYSLFGVAAALVICSNLLAATGRRLAPALPVGAARALAGSLRIEAATAVLPHTGKTATYFKTYDANDKTVGFIFSSDDFAPHVRGFGGKINLAIHIDKAGNLIDFHVIRSNETPAYLDMLTDWFDSLKNRAIFAPRPFANIDAVTGATVSSKAVLEALAESGGAFASDVLGQTGTQKIATVSRRQPDLQGAYLVVAVLLTFLVIYWGGFWSRLFVLAFNVFIGGIFLNAQFSTEQIASLLSLAVPLTAPTGAFILIVGVPLLALLFGNIYCGYLCPFGALQELFGYLLADRLKPTVTIKQMRKARFVKYIILFLIIGAFFLSRNHETLAVDPLIRIFSLKFLLDNPDKLLLLTAAVALVGSLFYSRFWCRYLCPAGAFLSLFNKIAVLRRYLPAKHYANCEYGVSYNDKLDCIFCDKCRYEKTSVVPVLKPVAGFGSRYLLPAVLVIAIGIAAVSVKSLVSELPASSAASAAVSSGGQPRNVDLQQIRTMIRENKLSDREADYYKKIE
jgi:predicted membrane-bound spermidine synthase